MRWRKPRPARCVDRQLNWQAGFALVEVMVVDLFRRMNRLGESKVLPSLCHHDHTVFGSSETAPGSRFKLPASQIPPVERTV